MKRYLLNSISLILFVLLAKTGLFAQNSTLFKVPFKLPEIDPRIEVLSKRYTKTQEIHGYRIQIISSQKSDMARKAKSKFASIHRNIQAHEIYQQPFFIIKVGDFLTKLEAEKFHREIAEEFPGSFVLPDLIDPFKQYTYKQTD